MTGNVATFWVEVSDSLDTDKVIYIYYGNSAAESASNGEETFIFFDDFNTDRWVKTGSTITVSGGQTHWDSTGVYGDGEQDITTLGTGWAIGGHVYQDTNPNVGLILIGVRDSYGSAYADTVDGLFEFLRHHCNDISFGFSALKRNIFFSGHFIAAFRSEQYFRCCSQMIIDIRNLAYV